MADLQILNLLYFARAVVYDAGEYLLRRFKRLKSRPQASISLAAAQSLAVRVVESTKTRLFEQYPYLEVCTPPYSVVPSEGLGWVINPVEGVINFTIGLPGWCFAFSLIDFARQSVELAVAYAPALRIMAWAFKNGGFWVNGKRIKAPTAARKLAHFIHSVSLASEIGATSKYVKFFKRQEGKKATSAMFESPTLQLIMLALGRVDTAFIPQLQTEQAAAGVLFVTQAGGAVLDEYGSVWVYEPGEHKDVWAGFNTQLLDDLRKVYN